MLLLDFPVFPRSLAKTETFGVSLMDLGTGIFLFSSALTSSFARSSLSLASPASSSSSSSSSSSVSSSPSSSSSLLAAEPGRHPRATKAIQKALVLTLGVGRLAALKFLSYPEHVSEYGKSIVHKNDIFTF